MHTKQKFQSTLRRTERQRRAIGCGLLSTFQSTLRRTERPQRANSGYLPYSISIHAPTNGATWIDYFTKPAYAYFNPRSDERSDRNTLLVFLFFINFNPRSDERSDGDSYSTFKDYTISIHAPTNGATTIILFSLVLLLISIHAPTNGATL